MPRSLLGVWALVYATLVLGVAAGVLVAFVQTYLYL